MQGDTRLEPQGTHVHRVKSRLTFRKNWLDRVADFLTRQFGSLWFLILHAIFFLAWIEWNVGWFGFEPFDPYPFNLLTMTVSLEAIFLAIIVLISQNRQSHIADVRQQIDFEIDVRAEDEIAKVLRVLGDIHRHLQISKPDRAQEDMEAETDLEWIQKEIEQNSDL